MSEGVCVAHLLNFSCCPIMRLYVACCDRRYDFRIQMMFVSSLSPIVCRRALVLLLFVFVCIYWCPTHIVLCFCFVFLRLVYSMLPVSLDYPFLIAQTVFSNVYLNCAWRFGKE